MFGHEFDKLLEKANQQVRENQERWKEINKLYGLIDEKLKNNDPINSEEMAELLLLLTDQIRPVAEVTKQTEELRQDINDMFGMLGGK